MKPKLAEFISALTYWVAGEQLDISIRGYRGRGMKEGATALFLTKTPELESFIQAAVEGGTMKNAVLELVAERENKNWVVDPNDEILRFDEFGRDGLIVY